MTTACIERSHTMYETRTYIGPRTRNKTLLRNFMGHAKMHTPEQFDLNEKLKEMGVMPLFKFHTFA